jgi:multiple sugar transport system permease protein
MRRRIRVRTLLAYGGVLLFLVFALFPFYWMAVTSLKPNRELFDLNQVPLITRSITLDHYTLVLFRTQFWRWALNSLIVSVTATLTAALVSTLAAYAVVRLRFWGADTFGTAIFITYLVPPTLLFLPLSRVVGTLGLTDSLWALIVTYPTFLVPFCTWLLMGYLRTIPRELEESAMIDGASRIQALLLVVLPVAAPGVLTAVMFSFTLSWGHFIYALAFVSSTPSKLLTVGLATELVRGDVFYWGSLMAGAMLASVPVVAVYGLFTRRFVSGLLAGAVKG